jgi:hypothetical protein
VEKDAVRYPFPGAKHEQCFFVCYTLAMDKLLLGKIFNLFAIALFIIAGIIYAVTRIGRVPFWFIEAGMIVALASIILLHKDKTAASKPFRVLNWLFIFIPILISIGVIIFIALVWYAFGNSDWQF